MTNVDVLELPQTRVGPGAGWKNKLANLVFGKSPHPQAKIAPLADIPQHIRTESGIHYSTTEVLYPLQAVKVRGSERLKKSIPIAERLTSHALALAVLGVSALSLTHFPPPAEAEMRIVEGQQEHLLPAVEKAPIKSYLDQVLELFPTSQQPLISQRVQQRKDDLLAKVAIEQAVGVDRIKNTRVWKSHVERIVKEDLEHGLGRKPTAAEYNLWTNLVLAQIGIESKGESKVKDGLLQITPQNKDRILDRMEKEGRLKKPKTDYNVLYSEDNIRMGLDEDLYLYKLFKGNLGLTFTAYNMGEGNVGNLIYKVALANPNLNPQQVEEDFNDPFKKATAIYGKDLSLFTYFKNPEYFEKLLAFLKALES